MSYIHYNNLDYDHIPKESTGKYLFKSLCNQDPNNVLNVDAVTGEFITSQKYLQDSIKTTYLFKNYGLKKGDRIVIVSENTLNYCIPVLAGLYSGIVVCPVNPLYTLGELQHALSYSKPHLVFCSEEVLPLVLQIKDEVEYIKDVFLLNEPNNKEVNVSFLEKALQTISDPISNYEPEDIDCTEDDAIILMSSGTTGCPKGVLLNQQGIRHCIGFFKDPNLGDLKSTDVTLQVIPFFHILGFMIQLFCFACSAKVVVLTKFKPDLYLKNIQDHKVTKLYSVPSLVVFLAKSPLVSKYDISSVEHIIVGGAPISVGVIEEVEEKLKSVKICQVYGMTELGGMMTMQTVVGNNKIGSVGVVPPGVSSKVCNPDSGLALKPLEMGELCFKSSAMMKGYISNTGLVRNCFDDDGFYHTGDLGYYDHDKNFFVIDRIKELIKYKGFQVAPAELEDLVSQHPDVKECAVTSIPDDRAGELPMAFVVRKENTDVTEEEIVKFVAEKISVQKQLHGGVKFLDEIPKTSSGKILRKQLKELAVSL